MRTPGHHLVPRVLGALLALGIAWIHVVDQGGLRGDKTPSHVGIGYWALEATGLVLAAVMIAGPAISVLARAATRRSVTTRS